MTGKTGAADAGQAGHGRGRPGRRRLRGQRGRQARARTPGQLGTGGVKRSNAVAKEADGKLDIPADPSGALAYTFGRRQASAGQVEIDSQNKSSIDHDISIEGNGVNEKGEVVKNGGVSKVSVDLKPGSYTFYCSVPGPPRGRHGRQAHREVTAAARPAAARASSRVVLLAPRG